MRGKTTWMKTDEMKHRKKTWIKKRKKSHKWRKEKK